MVDGWAQRYKYSEENMVELARLEKAQEGRSPEQISPPLCIFNIHIPSYPAANPVWGPKRVDGVHLILPPIPPPPSFVTRRIPCHQVPPSPSSSQ
jgi:hypothetical protein